MEGSRPGTGRCPSPRPARRVLRYRSRFWAGSETNGEQSWGFRSGSLGLCSMFEGPEVMQPEGKAERAPFPGGEHGGAGELELFPRQLVTTDLWRSLWSRVTRKPLQLDCSSPL